MLEISPATMKKVLKATVFSATAVYGLHSMDSIVLELGFFGGWKLLVLDRSSLDPEPDVKQR